MKSIEVMDKYISTYGEQISAAKIFNVVSEIFGINLDKVSILDKKMQSHYKFLLTLTHL